MLSFETDHLEVDLVAQTKKCAAFSYVLFAYLRFKAPDKKRNTTPNSPHIKAKGKNMLS